MCFGAPPHQYVGLTAIVCPTLYKRFCHRRLRCSSKGKGRCHIYLVPCLPGAMFTSPESKRKFQNQLACEGDPSPAKTSDTPRRKRFKVWHGFRRAQQQSLEHENHDVTDDWSPIQDPSSSPEIVHRNDPVEECLHRDEQRWVAQRDAVPLQPLNERLQAGPCEAA